MTVNTVEYPFSDIIESFDALTKMITCSDSDKSMTMNGNLTILDDMGIKHNLNLHQLNGLVRALSNSHNVLRLRPIYFLISQYLLIDLKDVKDFDYYEIRIDAYNEQLLLKVRVKPNDELLEYKLLNVGAFNQISINYCISNWLHRNELIDEAYVGGIGVSWLYQETSDEISFNIVNGLVD